MTNADFESLVSGHQTMVYSIAFNFFRNAALAEEVAQDVFLQLYKDRHVYKSNAHIVSWLRRTTAHRCIDALRRRSSQTEVQVDELPDIPDVTVESDPLLRERLWR